MNVRVNRDVAELLLGEEGAAELLSEHDRAERQRHRALPWKWLSDYGDDPIGQTPPPVRWLLRRPDDHDLTRSRGVVPLGKVGALLGKGGVGKSTLLCQLALAVATGEPWLGMSVAESGPVLLALGEEDTADILRKLHWAALAMRLTTEQRIRAAQMIMPLGLAGHRASVLETDTAGNVVESPWFSTLRGRMKNDGAKWALCIFDPLSRFSATGAESDNDLATRVAETFETLPALPGNPAVIVSHHTGKGAKGKPLAEDARGSSAFTCAFRWVLSLTEDDDEGRITLSLTKRNAQPAMPAIDLVRGDGGILAPAEYVDRALARARRTH